MPVFVIFRPNIRIIDQVKKATLSRLLLDTVIHTAPGEKLDDKLASMLLPDDFGMTELPPPSSDENSWWDTPDLPNGVLPLSMISSHWFGRTTSPFNEESSSTNTSLSSSPSSSDEALYSAAVMTPGPPPIPATVRKPPPPPPPPGRSSNGSMN